MKIIILYLFLLGLPNYIFGQDTYQVITKLIQKDFEYTGQLIKIDAEKANITINTWEINKVQIEIKLIAKHPELAKAKQALDYLNYIISPMKKELLIKNYILISGSNASDAKLNAEYKVFVPKNCSLTINNSLGNIEINDFKGILKINHKMGDLTISNSSGELLSYLEIGDLTCENVDFKGNINTEYAEINLRNIKGEYYIDTKMGNLTIKPDKALFKLEINSNNTIVNFINTNCWDFNYFLKANNGSINGLQQCNLNPIYIVKNTMDKNLEEKEFIFMKRKDLSQIKIVTKFTNINFF